MEANFKQALAWVRESETGHTDSDTANAAHWGNDDDPADSGGRTSRGITQREWDAYCRIAGLPQSDVWKAPNGAIDDIYHRSYWFPYCPTFPPGMDYFYFDAAVLHGPVEATIMLQESLGVKTDGHIGVITSAALSHVNDLSSLIDKMAGFRIKFDKLLTVRRPKDKKFLGGWLKRVEFVQHNARTLVPRDDVPRA